MSYHQLQSPQLLRGIGDAVTTTPEASNRTSGFMLIGLGALIILGGAIVFLPKRSYKANASRKRKHRARRSPGTVRRRKAAKRVPSTKKRAAAKQYDYWAKVIRRDLDAGFPASDVDASLREQYDKDGSEYRLDGIRSASQFVKGVRARL